MDILGPDGRVSLVQRAFLDPCTTRRPSWWAFRERTALPSHAAHASTSRRAGVQPRQPVPAAASHRLGLLAPGKEKHVSRRSQGPFLGVLSLEAQAQKWPATLGPLPKPGSILERSEIE